jgi:hypothetical protein
MAVLGARSALRRLHQRADAHNRHHALHVIGEHVERHLGRDLGQRHRQEVRPAHPAFDGAEGMLGRLSAQPHGIGIFVEARLHRLEHRLMLPARDPPLAPWRALGLPDVGHFMDDDEVVLGINGGL